MRGIEIVQGTLPERARHLSGAIPSVWRVCARRMPQRVEFRVFSASLAEQQNVEVFASVNLMDTGEAVGYWLSVRDNLAVWLSIGKRDFLVVASGNDGIFDCEILLPTDLWETNLGQVALMTERIGYIYQERQQYAALKENWSWEAFPLPKDDEPQAAGGQRRGRAGFSSSSLTGVQMAVMLCREYLSASVPDVILSGSEQQIPQGVPVLIAPPKHSQAVFATLLLPESGLWRHAAVLPPHEQVHRFVFRHPIPPTVLDAWEIAVPLGRLAALWYPGLVRVCFERARQAQ